MVTYLTCWIPGKENRKAVGRLSITEAENCVELSSTSISRAALPMDQIDTLWGEDESGEKYTLINDLNTSISAGYDLVFYQFCIKGCHIKDFDEIGVSKVTFNIDSMREWAGMYAPDYLDNKDDTSRRVVFESRIDDNAIVIITRRRWWSDSYYEKSSKLYVVGSISYGKSMKFSDAWTYIQGMKEYLHFVFDSKVSFDSIVYESENNKLELFDTLYSKLNAPSDKLDNNFVGFTVDEIASKIENWFSIKRKYSAVVALYNSAFSSSVMEVEFLLAIQALESFHRHKYPAPQNDIDSYNATVSAIKKVIFEYDKDLASKSDELFYEHGYEMPLGKRLSLMVKESNAVVKIGNSDEISSFCYYVGLARNYHTHYSPEAKEPLEEEQYIYVNRKLKYIIEYFLLREIGMEKSRIEEIFSERYRRHRTLKATWKSVKPKKPEKKSASAAQSSTVPPSR